MSTHMRQCLLEGRWGALYLFDNTDDGLSMHRHDKTTAHSVQVLGGAVVIYGRHGANRIDAHTGEQVDINWSDWHEIRAVAPHTVIFNRYLNGLPAEYTEADMWGNFQACLTHKLGVDGVLTLLPEYYEEYP